MFGKRILVLVPHPDDEVVACSAAIGRAQQQGAKIFALYLTHGCIARDVMWRWDRKNYDQIVARRKAEGEAVAAFLNITPIGWSNRPARYLWQEMATVYAEIQAAMAAHDIGQIWLPAYEGGNPDHDALNAIGWKISQQTGGVPLPLAGGVRGGLVNTGNLFASPPLIPPASGGEVLTLPSAQTPYPFVLEFAEYNFLNGKPHAQTFPSPNGTEQTLTLTDAERRTKLSALQLYASEKANLNYVGALCECYRPLAAYDYCQPPHRGTLWYARFQWVPFRHPRVDFTKPADVSRAIAAFGV